MILCVPVGGDGRDRSRDRAAPGAGRDLTDVGSVKQAVIDTVGPQVPDGVQFIPGHPLAGTEHSGPASGFASLFDNRWCLLTPLPGTDPAAVGCSPASGANSARRST